MNIYDYTSISRVVNPFVYPSHRLLVMLVPLAGILLGAYTLITTGDLGLGIIAGFYAGASAMLAWVLGREVDPDNPITAFIALGIATLGAFIATPNILALAGAVIIVRIVNRIVGYPAKIPDSILALALGLATMLLTPAWVFGAVVVLALALDAFLPEPADFQLSFVLAGLLIMLPTWGYLNVMLPNPIREWLLPVLGMGVLFAVHLITLPRFTSRCDATDEPIIPMRLRGGMALLLVMALVFALLYGDAGVFMLMPLWGVFLATVVYRLVGMVALRRGGGGR